MESLYDVLGVQFGASELEIRKAYRALSLQVHPDKNRSANATFEFQRLNAAYELLKNREAREIYDTQLKAAEDEAKANARAEAAAKRASYDVKERQRRRGSAKSNEYASASFRHHKRGKHRYREIPIIVTPTFQGIYFSFAQPASGWTQGETVPSTSRPTSFENSSQYPRYYRSYGDYYNSAAQFHTPNSEDEAPYTSPKHNGSDTPIHREFFSQSSTNNYPRTPTSTPRDSEASYFNATSPDRSFGEDKQPNTLESRCCGQDNTFTSQPFQNDGPQSCFYEDPFVQDSSYKSTPFDTREDCPSSHTDTNSPRAYTNRSSREEWSQNRTQTSQRFSFVDSDSDSEQWLFEDGRKDVYESPSVEPDYEESYAQYHSNPKQESKIDHPVYVESNMGSLSSDDVTDDGFENMHAENSKPDWSRDPHVSSSNTFDDLTPIFTSFEDTGIDYSDSHKRESKIAAKRPKAENVEELQDKHPTREKGNNNESKEASCTEYVPFESLHNRLERDAAAAAEQKRRDAAIEIEIKMYDGQMYRRQVKPQNGLTKKLKNFRDRLAMSLSESDTDAAVSKVQLRSIASKKTWMKKNGDSNEWEKKVVELPSQIDNWRSEARRSFREMKTLADEDRDRANSNLDAAINHIATLGRQQVEISGQLGIATVRFNREWMASAYKSQDAYFLMENDPEIKRYKRQLTLLANELKALHLDVAKWHRVLAKIDFKFERIFNENRLTNAKKACEMGEFNKKLNFAASAHPTSREICLDIWREIAAVSAEEAQSPTELQEFVVQKYKEWLELDEVDGTIKGSILDFLHYETIDDDLLEIGGSNFGGYGLSNVAASDSLPQPIR